MLTPEDHATLLRSFEVDRLLKLVTLEAKRLHDGHFAMLAFTSGYKVAFGTPDLDSGMGRPQLAQAPSFPTLKEALIAALVAGKDFDDYFSGNVAAWWHKRGVWLVADEGEPFETDDVFPCGPVLSCPRCQCQHLHYGHVEEAGAPNNEIISMSFSCEWCCAELVLSITQYHGQALMGWHDRHGDTACGPDCERYPTAAAVLRAAAD